MYTQTLVLWRAVVLTLEAAMVQVAADVQVCTGGEGMLMYLES